MQYEIFETKVKKFADFLKLIVKHLVKVSIAAGIVLAITITLLITKGMILGSETGPTEINYGEALQYKVRAFLSRVKYEYYDLSTGQWTEQAPIAPGDYQVRAVSNATIGHKYSKAKNFSIVPLKMTVKVAEDSMVYGDIPALTGETPYGDRIECTSFIYTEDMKYVKPDITKIRIYDEAGNDVTDRYKLETTNVRVNFLPRPITLESASDEKIYDGKPLNANDYSVTSNSLADNDVAVLTYEGSSTDAGIHQNIFKVQILNSSGTDVTKFYNITYVYGSLTVHKRPVTVETISDEQEYDSIPRTFEGFDHGGEYGLVSGHSIQAYDWVEILNAGTADNTASFEVYDRYGAIQTHNYEIQPVYGKITTTKRVIRVHTPSETRAFYGEAWKNTQLDCDSLGVNDYFVINDSASIQFVGEIANKVDFTIKNGITGTDVFDSYEIIYREGTLKVTHREMQVIAGTQEFIYNGRDNRCEYFDCYSDDDYEWPLQGNFDFSVVTATTVKDVCSFVDNHITIQIKLNGKDVTSNFIIDYTPGKIRVVERPITIITPDRVEYYNRELFTATDAQVIDIVEGHRLVVTESTALMNPGSAYNVFTKYDILDENNRSVLKNYSVGFIHGIITVEPRPIVITTASAEKIYDGTPLTTGRWEVAELVMPDIGNGWDVDPAMDIPAIEWYYNMGLISGDRISGVSPNGSQTDVGSSPNGCSSLSSVRIVDSSGRDVTQYYSLVVIEGTLTVTPRPITVTTQSDSFMYDDQYHSFTQISVGGSYGLVKGHTASAGYATEFRFVSDSGENHVEVLIRSGSRDVTHNYEIEFNYGIVEVIPRVLNVQTNSISAMYDDTGHYDHRISVTGANRLCTGHVIVVDTDSAIYVDAVTNGKNEVLFHIMHGEEDRTENYEIRGNYGSVNISKRPITVTSASFEGVYDGLDHGGGLSLVPGEYGLCYGHALNVISAPEFKNVVTGGINLIEFGVVKFGVEDVTKNYDITFNPGTITITHRYVYVNTGSDTWYYDGKAHHCHDYETVDSEFVRFHDVRIPRFTSITEVGTEYNVLEFEVFDEEGISVTSNYIIAIEEYGILQVLESNVDIPDEPPVPDDPPILPAPLPTPAPGDVDGGPLEENGNLGLPLKPDVDSFDPELGDPAVAYYIFSTTTGQVYLKLKSFGDLNGNTWGEADDYYMLFDNFSAAYLTSKALESAGKGEGFMRITSMFNQYVLPYYASTKDVDPQISDVHPIGDASQEYMLYYYNWSYTPGAYTLPEEAAEYEREYSKFVHDNYLTINKSTLEYLQGVITAQGFDINDPYVISKVAAYIQNAASYNLKYDRALDQSEDIVIAFLDQYKEGICQHYATAATMLYRALGIPARYTIGYVGSTIAGEVSEIYSNQGHAWVEVYINGLGWVNVEVTGSGSGLDIPGGNHTETKKETIVVTPLYQHKIYDGKPLVAENKISELDPVLAELLANDYRYEVTVEGYQYGVGKSNSYVTSFTLYDPSGNEVNDRYNIVFEDGLLEVAYGIISIYLYEKTYEYNGHSFSYGLDEYAIISMPANVRFEMHSINISLKNVGSLSSNEINKDIRKYLTYSIYSGNSSTDVWENYIVTVVNFMDGGEYVPIKVNPREIVVATGSESKYYDSKPLTNDTYYVSKGQLADGHRLNIEVIGSITAVGSVSNTVDISSLVIYDADGNIVTKNYNVVGYELGTLEVMK